MNWFAYFIFLRADLGNKQDIDNNVNRDGSYDIDDSNDNNYESNDDKDDDRNDG